MATENANSNVSYPLAVYNYRVIVDNQVTMSFSEVAGLEIEHEQVLYRHGFSWLMGDHLLRGQRKPINVVLKRGVAKQRQFLYAWIQSADKKDVSIELCDERGNAIVSWDVTRALPLKLDAPGFSASANQVAIESLTLVAHDLKLTYHE
ncbi:MAG: phage tail protein [Bacteroidota bacterium]